jgi:hypothetical protein
MKMIILALVLCTGAGAQTTTVTGAPRFLTRDTPATFNITLTPVFAASTATPERILAAPVSITFSTGALSLAVIPTDATTPSGQKYRVTYAVPSQLVNGHRIGPVNIGPCYWTVPTSATPVDVATVENCTSASVAPSLTVLPAQISTVTAIAGQVLCKLAGGSTGWCDAVTGTGLLSLNSQTQSMQTFSTGSSCVDWSISSAAGVHTFCLPTVSGTARGLVTSAQYASWNAKQDAISGAPGTWPSAFAPSVHASTHAAAGSDPLALTAGQVSGLASVATTGLYSSLSGTPTIPSNTSQISESGNLYFTEARARAAFSYTGVGAYLPMAATVPADGCATWSSGLVGSTGSACGSGGGSMVYPSAGVPSSTGSAWGASYTVGTAASNLVQLTVAAKLPALDASLLTSVPACATCVLSGDSRLTDARAPTPHNLLSGYHGDTTAGSVARGDLITGQGSTPAWTRLPLGASGRYLRSDGTDAAWASIQAADVPTLNQSTSGNAATATALASTPGQCTTGQYSTGVTTSGAANCAQVAYAQVSGTPVINAVLTADVWVDSGSSRVATPDGTVLNPYKSLAAAVAALPASGACSIHIAPGSTYSETGPFTLSGCTPTIYGNGATITVSGGISLTVPTRADNVNLVGPLIVNYSGTARSEWNSGSLSGGNVTVTAGYIQASGVNLSGTGGYYLTVAPGASFAGDKITGGMQLKGGGAGGLIALINVNLQRSSGYNVDMSAGGTLSANGGYLTTVAGTPNIYLPTANSAATSHAIQGLVFLAGSGVSCNSAAVYLSWANLSIAPVGCPYAYGAYNPAIMTTQMPALTGDVTSTASSVATTVGKINGTALSGLATGLLKNATSTGIPSIAIAGTDYQAPGTSYSFGSGYLSGTKTAGTGGVTANTLVRLDTATPSNTIITAAAGDSGILGIAASTASATASVEVVTRGVVGCVADNATTIGNLVGAGTATAGRCRDLGVSAPTSVSVGTQVIGRWLGAVAAGATGSVQLYGPGHYGAQVQATDLPSPSTSSKGGLQAKDCTGTGHVLSLNTDGTVTCSADGGGSGTSVTVQDHGTEQPQRTSINFRDGLTASDVSSVTTIDYNPRDTRVFTIKDEFGSGTTSTGNVGQTAWNYDLLGAASTVTAAYGGTWPNLGLTRTGCETGYASCGVALHHGTSATPYNLYGALGSNVPWGMTAVFKLVQTTNTRFRAGFANQCGSVAPATGWFLRYDTNQSDTYFMYENRVSGAATTANSGVAVDTSFHTLDIYSTVAGTIHFALDGANDKTVCASGCDITATPSTLAMDSCLVMATDTNASASYAQWDMWAFSARLSTSATNKRN